MMDWGFGWGVMMLLGILLMVLFWGGIIALAVWAVRSLVRKEQGRDGGGPVEGSALEILKQRYARGEITREQYQEIRRDLEGRDLES